MCQARVHVISYFTEYSIPVAAYVWMSLSIKHTSERDLFDMAGQSWRTTRTSAQCRVATAIQSGSGPIQSVFYWMYIGTAHSTAVHGISIRHAYSGETVLASSSYAGWTCKVLNLCCNLAYESNVDQFTVILGSLVRFRLRSNTVRGSRRRTSSKPQNNNCMVVISLIAPGDRFGGTPQESLVG